MTLAGVRHDLTLVTAPAIEPLTLAEAKLHLRVADDATDEDALILALIRVAREYAEARTGRALITQTWDLALSGFPACESWYLPLAPLQSVSSITYVDTAGATQTWAATDYQVQAFSGPFAQRGRVGLAYGKSYPSTRDLPAAAAVTVRFVAGYGADAGAVPEGIRHAMLIAVAYLFEHREGQPGEVKYNAQVAGGIAMPSAAELLLWPYRSW